MLAGLARDISQQVLRTDVAGMPLEWIDYREAVRLYHAEQVAYDCGTRLYSVFGGYSAVDGSRSRIDVNSIIATHGTSQSLSRNRDQYVPPLNNRTLFKRAHATVAAELPEGRRHQLALPVLVAAFRVHGIEMDADEVEYILANLIFGGRIKGYIAHGRCVVLSKKDPWPAAA